jgi:hypothetical protein
VVLDTVDRDSKLKPTTRRMPGLMRYHDFVFDSATQITVKELTSDPVGDVWQLRFDKPWQFLTGLPVVPTCPYANLLSSARRYHEQH